MTKPPEDSLQRWSLFLVTGLPLLLLQFIFSIRTRGVLKEKDDDQDQFIV